MNVAENLSLEDINGEIWKDIEDYKGIYQVSSFGRVKSLDRVNIDRYFKGRILKQYREKLGYCRVSLIKNGKTKNFLVHRLIAFAFIENPNPEKFDMIDHKNGVRYDNRIENLRWLNNRENVTDGYRRKDTTSNFVGVYWNTQKGKWVSQIIFNNKHFHLGLFNNEKEAHKAYLIALEKGYQTVEDERIDKEKIKCVMYDKKLNSYYVKIILGKKNFYSKQVETQKEAIRIKQEVSRDFSNINKYRKKPYDLKEEFSKLDIKILKKNRYYNSFKHLIKEK